MKNIGIYARVSTKKQETDNQIRKLKEYAKIREWNVEGVYTDEISGRKRDRSGLNEILEKAKTGKIDGILVWKLDRLARSVKDAIGISEFLRTHNRELIIFGSNIDTSTAEGRFFFNVTASFAELESAFISERTILAYENKKAHAEALNQKVRWGRKKKKFSAQEIEYIEKELSKEYNIGFRKIAEQINYWRMLKNNELPKNKQLPKVSYSTIRRVFQNGGG